MDSTSCNRTSRVLLGQFTPTENRSSLSVSQPEMALEYKAKQELLAFHSATTKRSSSPEICRLHCRVLFSLVIPPEPGRAVHNPLPAATPTRQATLLVQTGNHPGFSTSVQETDLICINICPILVQGLSQSYSERRVYFCTSPVEQRLLCSPGRYPKVLGWAQMFGKILTSD